MAFRPGVNAPYTTTSYSVSQGTGHGGANYIPEIFSKKMLKDFYNNTIFRDITNTDYQGEIKAAGDKIHIRRVPTISIGDYKIGGSEKDGTAGAIEYEVPQVDADYMLIDQAKYWAFRMDYIDEAQTDLPLISEFSANAALQLSIAVDTNMMAYMTTAANVDSHNQGATAGVKSGNINLGVDTSGNSVLIDDGTSGITMADFIVNMNVVLDENNIPSEGRWVALPAAMIGMLKKGDLRRADITGDTTGVIRTGLVGMVDRMKIYQTNQLPKGATETTAYLIPFGTNEACSFAAQITKTESLPIINSFGTFI